MTTHRFRWIESTQAKLLWCRRPVCGGHWWRWDERREQGGDNPELVEFGDSVGDYPWEIQEGVHFALALPPTQQWLERDGEI